MEELLAKITAATGLEPELAQKATGLILGFLAKEGPKEQIDQLLAAIPGAQEAIASAGDGAAGGMLGSLMGAFGAGGGIMALGQKLMSEGLSMDQIKTLGRELFAYGRETAGEDVMGPIVGSIPGLSQFV
ncbi:DUF2267 domain-containing protein [Enterovirga rhinocerotis]|uniref:DUF2267 domain-containing protein n=1 Tax=Enterovirga rhinocerotis TaxID=1339210 RepID=A0A4R7BWK1_9HYPH|nr:DUF2267 domain-containing protein [Enterovirga rhinocerotis]TDR89951.1 hypothetical protein EV668_2788 [Enterovirga rhinocerotis]